MDSTFVENFSLMLKMNKDIKDVDQYIATSPEEIQGILKKVRSIIQKHAPEAVESMAYCMPAYKTFKKPLVYFAAQSKHLGFYATPQGNEAFVEELSKYKQGKGSIQFPYNDVPYDLIEKIVKYRVAESEAMYKNKV